MQDNRFDILNNAQVIKAMINKAMRKTTPQAASVIAPRNVYMDGYPPPNPVGNIQDGTAQGQLAFWDATAGMWVHTEVTEAWWDDTNKAVGVGADSGSYTSVSRFVVADLTLDTATSYIGSITAITKTAGASDGSDDIFGSSVYSEFDQSGGTIGTLKGLNLSTISTVGTTDNIMGLTNDVTLTAGTTGAIEGYVGHVIKTDGATTENISGLTQTVHNIAGNIGGKIYGAAFSVTHSAGTVVEDVIGIYNNLDVDSDVGGNVIGLYINQDYDGTVSGTTYGIYIKENTGQDYGIYQDGAAPNVFGGDITTAGDLTVGNQQEVRFNDSDGDHYTGFKAPATIAADTIYTLPAADGTSGQVLQTDGSKVLSWATAGGASIPAGIIAMWSGLLVNIPTGWALCDGTSGTPDLRSMFIKGAAAGADPGTTGGAATHSHTVTATGTVSQPTFTGDALGNHNHSFSATSGTPSATMLVNDLGMAGAATDAHTHDISGTTGNASAGTPSGTVSQPTFTGNLDNTSSASNEPSFYSLAFIMKT